ncbi:hypothetical protein GF420_05090 [candidate division GN15 bacterium]|nr:hypothetical protein [candidate division GN15 bacterium]
MEDRFTQHPSSGNPTRTLSVRIIIGNTVTLTAALAVFLWLANGAVAAGAISARESVWLPLMAAVAVALFGSLMTAQMARLGLTSSTEDESPREYDTAESELPARTRLTMMASSTGSTGADLQVVRRSADRLTDIEDELIRRISEHYGTDRRMRALLIELQICSSRMKAQLNECCMHADRQRQSAGIRWQPEPVAH